MTFVTSDNVIYISLSACVIATIYIKNNNNSILMSLGWSTMRMLTRLQMLANNMTSWCCDENSSQSDKVVITIVKDGKEIKEFVTDKYRTSDIASKCRDIDGYEFLYKTVNDMREQTITIRDSPESLSNDVKTSAPLLMAAIKARDKEFLVSNLGSFFVVGNKLFNRSFVQWYLNKYHHLNIYDEDYSVVLYTSMGTPVLLTKHDEIIIEMDSYVILYNGKPKQENKPVEYVWRGLSEDDIQDDEDTENSNDKGIQTSGCVDEEISAPSTPPSSTLSPFAKPEHGESPSPLSLQSQATEKSYDVVNHVEQEDSNTEDEDEDECEACESEGIRTGPKEKGFWSWFV